MSLTVDKQFLRFQTIHRRERAQVGIQGLDPRLEFPPFRAVGEQQTLLYFIQTLLLLYEYLSGMQSNQAELKVIQAVSPAVQTMGQDCG